MLTVEDCLERLVELTYTTLTDAAGNKLDISGDWDGRFINDVFVHASAGKAISTAQSDVILKLIRRYETMLVMNGLRQIEIDNLIANPQYKRPLYQSTNMPREVRWMGNSRLAFRCKFNAGIVEDIKKLKGNNYFSDIHTPAFHRGEKIWIVDVNSGNTDKVMDLIRRHNFEFDDQVTEFFLQIANTRNLSSSVETTTESIKVTVCNDDLLNGWLCGIQDLENV